MNLIDKLISDIEQALTHKLYNVALISVLTIPDIICQSIKETETKSKDYIEWFDNYVAKKYYSEIYSKEPSLNGNDFYALRCSLLHQGRSVIKGQNKQKHLEDFVFFASHNYGKLHLKSYSSENRLKIHLEEVFENIVRGYSDWKEQLSPEMLNQHESYKSLEIKEIDEEHMDAFETAIAKQVRFNDLNNFKIKF